MMTLELKNCVAELQNSVAFFFNQDFSKFNLQMLQNFKKEIEATLVNVVKEADVLETSLEARDATIRALGEKLSDLRIQNTEPFYVKDRKRNPGQIRKRSPSQRRKSLFRKEEITEWSTNDAQDHMKELSDQIARLSLQPMGLSKAEAENQVADISATRLYEAKALNLIKVARSRGLSDNRIRKFLKKKTLPDATINRCFNMVNESTGSEDLKALPKLPSSFNPIDGESDTEEGCFYDYMANSTPQRKSMSHPAQKLVHKASQKS